MSDVHICRNTPTQINLRRALLAELEEEFSDQLTPEEVIDIVWPVIERYEAAHDAALREELSYRYEENLARLKAQIVELQAQLHSETGEPPLTPEELAGIKSGIEDIKAGRTHTIEEWRRIRKLEADNARLREALDWALGIVQVSPARLNNELEKKGEGKG